MHLCISTQSSVRSLYLGSKLRRQWTQVLEDVRCKSGVDLFLHQKGDRCTIRQLWQNDLQQCQRSVAAYFSKYASKETQSAKKGFGGKAIEHPYYPARWWGCQRQLRQEVEGERFLLRIEGVEEDLVTDALVLAENWCNANTPIKSYRYDFELGYVFNGQTRPLGYGERSIFYFDDCHFSHVCNDLYQLAIYLVHVCNGAYVQCNRMSALQTPVKMWCMQ